MRSRSLILLAIPVVIAICCLIAFQKDSPQSSVEKSGNQAIHSDLNFQKSRDVTKKAASPSEQPTLAPATIYEALKRPEVGQRSLLQLRDVVEKVKNPRTLKIPLPMTDVKQAFDHLRRTASMVALPERWTEDDLFFYFSGGSHAYPVNDFSFGYALRKTTGDRHRWEKLEFNQPLEE
jgi:hypothetical protein